jgi:ankyrin repeat protein
MLIEHGADLDVTDDDDDDALCDGWTPLHFACFNGYLPLAKLLIEHGADANVTDRNGATAFHTACQEGHLEIVGLLLKAERNV